MNLQQQAVAASVATKLQLSRNTPTRTTPAGAGAQRFSARRRPRGITLIELLVVLAIIAIVAGFAIPSFLGLIASTRVSWTVNAFISDTRYARGEAMRRGKTVTICRSADPTAKPPKCSTGTGLAAGGWKEGWFVFWDEDGDGTFDSGADTVVRVQEAFASIGNFLAVNNAGNPVNNRNHISYDAMGRAVGLQSRWLVLAPGILSKNGSYTRTLCMNVVGRVRVQAGEAACS
jgi:type IV fimbrial biogenesis protein FimT